METQKTQIEQLNTEEVIIRTITILNYNGMELLIEDRKKHYPNSITGRQIFASEVQGDIYIAVMTIWGNIPIVDEKMITEE